MIDLNVWLHVSISPIPEHLRCWYSARTILVGARRIVAQRALRTYVRSDLQLGSLMRAVRTSCYEHSWMIVGDPRMQISL